MTGLASSAKLLSLWNLNLKILSTKKINQMEKKEQKKKKKPYNSTFGLHFVKQYVPTHWHIRKRDQEVGKKGWQQRPFRQSAGQRRSRRRRCAILGRRRRRRGRTGRCRRGWRGLQIG